MISPSFPKRRAGAVDAHVGSLVRLRRLTINMSQMALAEALGITFQQVQKYENGTNRISASRLQDIARILAVPVSLFFEGAPDPPDVNDRNEGKEEEDVIDFLSTSEGVELNRAFSRIENPNLRRCLIGLVQAVAGKDDEQVEQEERASVSA